MFSLCFGIQKQQLYLYLMNIFNISKIHFLMMMSTKGKKKTHLYLESRCYSGQLLFFLLFLLIIIILAIGSMKRRMLSQEAERVRDKILKIKNRQPRRQKIRYQWKISSREMVRLNMQKYP